MLSGESGVPSEFVTNFLRSDPMNAVRATAKDALMLTISGIVPAESEFEIVESTGKTSPANTALANDFKKSAGTSEKNFDCIVLFLPV